MTRGARDAVLLLHGLGRTPLSFVVTARLLSRAGFEPWPVKYPSRLRPIEHLAQHIADRLPGSTRYQRLHVLTHSLGGLVARYLIRAHRPANLGRVVMLSPPNQGSELARRLTRSRLFRTALGPAGSQLSLDAAALADLLGPIDFDLGIIIGDKALPLTAGVFDGSNDGKVSVAEARVEGMRDFLVVHRGHAFIMNDPTVVDQATQFFQRGAFRRV